MKVTFCQPTSCCDEQWQQVSHTVCTLVTQLVDTGSRRASTHKQEQLQ